jgi:excisionase family DNA binding protein
MTDYNLRTVTEVAEALRVSENTVRQMIKRGELPAVKVGKSYRIKQSDIDALLQTYTPRHAQ